MPRISVLCDEALFSRIQKAFPWGTQSAIVRTVLELLCTKVEEEGVAAIIALLKGKYDPLSGEPKRGKII